MTVYPDLPSATAATRKAEERATQLLLLGAAEVLHQRHLGPVQPGDVERALDHVVEALHLSRYTVAAPRAALRACRHLAILDGLWRHPDVGPLTALDGWAADGGYDGGDVADVLQAAMLRTDS